jgi:chemotaxis signal transduction protein
MRSAIELQQDLIEKLKSAPETVVGALAIPFVSRDRLWLIPATDVILVKTPLQITGVPGASNGVIGVASVDGAILTVVDFNHLVNEGTVESSLKERFILVRAPAGPLCVLVEAVGSPLRLEGFSSSSISGQIGTATGVQVLIDGESFLAFPVTAKQIAEASDPD